VLFSNRPNQPLSESFQPIHFAKSEQYLEIEPALVKFLQRAYPTMAVVVSQRAKPPLQEAKTKGAHVSKSVQVFPEILDEFASFDGSPGEEILPKDPCSLWTLSCQLRQPHYQQPRGPHHTCR